MRAFIEMKDLWQARRAAHRFRFKTAHPLGKDAGPLLGCSRVSSASQGLNAAQRLCSDLLSIRRFGTLPKPTRGKNLNVGQSSRSQIRRHLQVYAARNQAATPPASEHAQNRLEAYL